MTMRTKAHVGPWASRAVLLAAVLAALCACVSGSANRAQAHAAVPAQPGQPGTDSTFLENWFSNLAPVLANRTLLQLSLPGTHDTLTADLSSTVSDDANDMPSWVSYLLHLFKNYKGAGSWLRDQAKTQGLDIVSQLNAGIRFLDFRIVYSAAPDAPSWAVHDWYGLHMLQTNNLARSYLTSVRQWMDAHPTEIVVMWISRHGSTCNTTFADTPLQAMQEFFGNVTSIFDGLLFDRSISSMNTTVVRELVQRKHRMVLYVSAYHNFTGPSGSPLAMDGCSIDNKLGDKVWDEPESLPEVITTFRNAPARVAQDTAANMLYLRSMAADSTHTQQINSALLTFFPSFNTAGNIKSCATSFNIPGMDAWCPMYLQAVSQLTNYYNQIALETAIQQDLGLPNAIYLDAVDVGGLIRTGVQLFPEPLWPVNGSTGHPPVSQHNTTGYAYVDTLLLWSVRQACKPGAGAPSPANCAAATSLLEQRRAAHPLLTWDDATYGRLVAWPNVTITATAAPPAASRRYAGAPAAQLERAEAEEMVRRARAQTRGDSP